MLFNETAPDQLGKLVYTNRLTHVGNSVVMDVQFSNYIGL